jgi:ketosteroid isomerase-like protein
MSEQKVDALRRGFELWSVALSDPDETTWRAAMAEMVESYHPDALVDFSRTVPDFPAAEARAAMTSWVEDARGTFSAVHVEPTEMVDGGDAVMAAMRITGVGTLSGATMEAPFFYVFRYRGEQVISATTYKSRDEALAALGLAAP